MIQQKLLIRLSARDRIPDIPPSPFCIKKAPGVLSRGKERKFHQGQCAGGQENPDAGSRQTQNLFRLQKLGTYSLLEA